jgi:DNA repair protein RecO (recombination protein O)
MGTYQTKAVVLRTRNLGEADRVLVLLSEDYGKVEAVAKGARRQHSRFIGNTLPFNYLNVMLFTGHSLDQLSQADLLRSFAILREDLVKMAYASYWVELLDGFIPEREGAGEVFRFLLAAFLTLEQVDQPDRLNLAFQARLLNYLGYQPQLGQCLNCGNANPKDHRFFAPEAGGVICCDCALHFNRDACASLAGVKVDCKTANGFSRDNLISIGPEELIGLARLAVIDIRRLDQLSLTQRNRQTIQKILRAFVAYRLDRPLKSQLFLDRILD